MNVTPGNTYEAVAETGVTGLTGTINLGLYDNQGGVTSALATTGIIETPAGSGVYAATRTAPTLAGQYTLVWSLDGTTDPDQVITDELVVAFSPLTVDLTGPFYATVAQLATKLKVNPVTYQDDLERVLAAAKLEIDKELGYTLDDTNTAEELALVVSVNLARAQDLWLIEGLPVGVIGLGGETPLLTPRNSWERHANMLAPLKAEWGLA